ncbi:hypothetical protein NKJ73_24110 [Mesorhizobium sp. M0074]|uniref:hypothetical protein n=1 Tax=unclassified Mesorhizobium TaxID=325217 RepID=UPI003334E65A
MTTFGNISRALNRISGGAPGQTLCARIAERWPECWFCRLMSRIVEPNHCAIELERWQRRETYAAPRLPLGQLRLCSAEAIAGVRQYVALSGVAAARLFCLEGQSALQDVKLAKRREFINR